MMMKDQEVEDIYIEHLYINSDDGGVKEVHSKILETKVSISVIIESELCVVCIDDDCEVCSGPKG